MSNCISISNSEGQNWKIVTKDNSLYDKTVQSRLRRMARVTYDALVYEGNCKGDAAIALACDIVLGENNYEISSSGTLAAVSISF